MLLCLLKKMWKDEAGYIVSAELILVATIAVLAIVVGLSEVSIGINHELEDIGSAFGAANQSYFSFGQVGHQAGIAGSRFNDHIDFCDNERDIGGNTRITGESFSNLNGNW